MTTTAIAGGFAVCQTRLGAKVHDPKDPGADLGPMFSQVVSTLLRLTARHAERWLSIEGSHDVPIYGFERVIDPPPLRSTRAGCSTQFAAGHADRLGEVVGAGPLTRDRGPGGAAGSRRGEPSRLPSAPTGARRPTTAASPSPTRPGRA